MQSTRFGARNALSHDLGPIVVVNEVDRPGSRPDWVVDQTFELFDRLGASDSQLDFPVVYASALQGWSALDSDAIGSDMQSLFQTIVDNVAPPAVDPEGSLQLQVSALDYSTYVGVIGIGRIQRGRFSRNDVVCVAATDGSVREARILQILGFHGLNRVELDGASAGEIVAFTGVDGLRISDTLCDPSCIDPLPALKVDEPTLSMTFQVNDSPFAGQDGRFVTSRNLGQRLAQELIHNVALRVEPLSDPDKFKVSGRGELHLSILVENMRREGYELAISRPEVILREIDGVVHEPWETLTVDVESVDQGRVMERLGERRAELRDILPDSNGRVRLDYTVPSRGLIGFQSEFMTITRGKGLMYHTFDRYAERAQSKIGERVNGVLVSISVGKSLAYALFNLQERGRLFIGPGEQVYEGMVIGLHSRSGDLVVNPLKAKQLTNIRAAGSDENILLTPPLQLTLEAAIAFINDDELVEVTPVAIRVRKKLLRGHERKRAARAA